MECHWIVPKRSAQDATLVEAQENFQSLSNRSGQTLTIEIGDFAFLGCVRSIAVQAFLRCTWRCECACPSMAAQCFVRQMAEPLVWDATSSKTSTVAHCLFQPLTLTTKRSLASGGKTSLALTSSQTSGADG